VIIVIRWTDGSRTGPPSPGADGGCASLGHKGGLLEDEWHDDAEQRERLGQREADDHLSALRSIRSL